ncbi:hypothetical protein [Streptomyces sp. NPDC002082]|uniref:hypothetical protein n=1 Tax=Streptomyces sp. NPDC002082 TaxID=3154772 RepID=UPI003316A611
MARPVAPRAAPPMVGAVFVVDALVVATAALSTGPAKVASSDGSHVPKLCTAASLGRPSPVQWVRV